MRAAVIASVGIKLRCVAVSFNSYVSAKIGSERLGLFTLVMSVYGLAVTVATSGVNLAAVRLTAERVAHLSENGGDKLAYRRTVRSVLASCTAYSLLFSLAACALLYAFAPVIGKYLLADERTVRSLRFIGLSLPAISVSSAVSGCFTGLRKGYKNAFSALFEQFAKIVIISTALTLTCSGTSDPIEYSCLAVVGGSAVSEALSLVFNILLYIFDSKRPMGTKLSDKRAECRRTVFLDAARIALPVAVGAYARQGLSTAEHLAIPWGLKKSGLSSSAALSSYGSLLGMAFPLVLFPSVVLTSAAGLLIPELAEMRELGNKDAERRLIANALASSLLFSVGCAFVFYTFGELLGMSVYVSAEVGTYIKTIAPLVPVMYTDTVTDCILKGLGEQKTCMRINVTDSAVSLFFAFVLVPCFGIGGYVASVYICEMLNFILSFSRLLKCAEIDKNILSAGFLSLFAGFGAVVLIKLADIIFPYTCAEGIVLFSVLYAAFVVICVRTSSKRKKTQI